MCFFPMNVHNEVFNGVRKLRWQHLSPVVSTASSLPLSLSFCPSVSLSVVPNPVSLIKDLSLQLGDVGVFFLQSKVLCS